jgi:N-acetylglucosamine kinase
VVFGIILGSGVGGGVVVGGRLIEGFGGISGEWGHGPCIDPAAGGTAEGLPAFPCGCGLTGCLDAVCSARGMEKLHAALHGETLASTEITAGWHRGEGRAAATIALYVRHLSRALSVAVNTLGAWVVPVGGGLSADRGLIAAIDTALRPLVLADYPDPLVVPGHHAADGGLVGAGIAAIQAEADGRLTP